MLDDGDVLPFSFDGLAKIIPALMVFFALAFDVGYFYSIDIGWFSFFTISEHVVFALRALPIAIAGVIVFLLLFFIHDVARYAPKKLIEFFRRESFKCHTRGVFLISTVLVACGSIVLFLTSSFVCYEGGLCNAGKDLHEYIVALVVCATGISASSGVYEFFFKRLAFFGLKSLWIGVLSSGAVYVGLCLGYYVLFISLMALAAGTVIYFLMDPDVKIDELNRLIENDGKMKESEFDAISGQKRAWMGLRAVFLSINLVILTFFVGLFVGKAWYLEMQYSYKPTIITLDKANPMVGRIMHPGDKSMLFYKMKDDKDRSSGVRLVSRESIREVQLCKSVDDCDPENLTGYDAARVLVSRMMKQAHLYGHIRPDIRSASASHAGALIDASGVSRLPSAH